MIVHQRVLAVLVLAGLAAAFGLAFLTQAPNRLVTGTGIRLSELLAGPQAALLLPATLLLAGIFRPPSRRWHGVVLLASIALLVGWVALAGHQATRIAATATPLARTSLGGGFWVLCTLTALAAADAAQRLPLRPLWRTLMRLTVLLPIVLLLSGGALDALSLLKEYRNRQDVFDAALWRHLQIVLFTLVPTLLIGVPLGLAAFRSAAVARPLFAVLGVIQTVPSIALFGLLIGPLAWLAAAAPGWGLSGIGLLPAVIALTLYSLLHAARSTVAGLGQVPAPVVDAATGMGLTRTQIFWQVQVPIALPLLLSGLRVCTVQTIGMAVVAALIGAGGFGALMFQGLASSALDLVLLGVIPVVALAVAADAGFGALIQRLQAPHAPHAP
jgi:osmoprotectant transport system permease protein